MEDHMGANPKTVTIEGMSPDDIMALPREELESLVFCDEPVVFRAGSAEVLGRFSIADATLVLELAQIDGGGEGVLPTLWRLAERYAANEGLSAVEWIVHAVCCAKPNLKLRRVLDRMGFEVEQVRGAGMVYHLVRQVTREGRPCDRP